MICLGQGKAVFNDYGLQKDNAAARYSCKLMNFSNQLDRRAGGSTQILPPLVTCKIFASLQSFDAIKDCFPLDCIAEVEVVSPNQRCKRGGELGKVGLRVFRDRRV